MDISKIKIAIDTGDLQKAKDMLDKVEGQAKKTDSSVKGLSDSFLSVKTAVAAVATSAVISNYFKFADAFSSIDSKLKLATKSTIEFSNAQRELFNIAQNTRTSFEGTVDLYSKLSTSTEQLNISQDRLFKVTEAINKAGIIGGGSKEGINAALMQLGQAFSAGTLRGEELNSILEQTPRLARAIAEGMGVTVGELKKLGEQGSITAEKLFNAIENQASKLDSEYGKMALRVSESLTTLENSTIKAIGTIDKLTGASEIVAKSMKGWSWGIDELSKKLQTSFGDIESIGDIAVLTAKRVEILKERMAVKDANFMFGMQESELKRLDSDIVKIDMRIKALRQEQEKNASTTVKVVDSWSKLSPTLQKTIDPIRQIKDEYQKLREELKANKKDTKENIKLIDDKEKKDISDYYEKLGKDSKKAAEDLVKQNEEIGKSYTDLAKKGMTEYEQKLFDLKIEYVDFIKKTGDMKTGLEILAKAEENLNNKYSAEQQKKRNEDLDKQISALKDIYDLKEKQASLLLDENEKNQTLAKLYYERRIQEIALEKEKGDKSAEYYKQSEDYEKSLLDQTLFRYSATGQIIESVSSGMKSSMMDFFDYTSSGFGNLKKLALDLGNIIYKAVVQQMVVNPLVGALQTAATSYFAPSTSVNMGSSASANASALGIGGTDSNFMSSGSTIFNAKGGTYSSQSLSNYSNGIYSTPQVFAFAKGGAPNIGVFGEAGAEAIMPLTRDSSGSLGVKSVGGNSNGVVKVEVINQSNQEVQVTNTSTRNDLEGTILSVWINAVNTNKMGVRNMIAGAR